MIVFILEKLNNYRFCPLFAQVMASRIIPTLSASLVFTPVETSRLSRLSTASTPYNGNRNSVILSSKVLGGGGRFLKPVEKGGGGGGMSRGGYKCSGGGGGWGNSNDGSILAITLTLLTILLMMRFIFSPMYCNYVVGEWTRVLLEFVQNPENKDIKMRELCRMVHKKVGGIFLLIDFAENELGIRPPVPDMSGDDHFKGMTEEEIRKTIEDIKETKVEDYRRRRGL